MNLFLGSRGLGALPGWLGELPRRPRRAVLVPTAGNPMPAMPWVAVAESALAAAGLAVHRLDLEPASAAAVSHALTGADLVFVTGGHPLFLLEHVRRTGFDALVTAGVRAGELAYAGMSAGACLVAPDLAFHRSDDDPGRVTDLTGLGLISFYPLSHADRGREQRYARLIAEYGDRYEFVPVRDDEAVVVRGRRWERRASAHDQGLLGELEGG
jgi:dipeptidase E